MVGDAGDERRERDAQRPGDLPEDVDGRRALAELDLTQHRSAHAGALGEAFQGQPSFAAQSSQVRAHRARDLAEHSSCRGGFVCQVRLRPHRVCPSVFSNTAPENGEIPMAESTGSHQTLGAQAARQLANTTKTPPQWIGVTPRWLVSLLPWTPVEAGTYRVNRVKAAAEGAAGIAIQCSPSDSDDLPEAFIDYEEQPREHTLSTVTTTIEVQTRISDLYRSPMDQVREQLGVLIEMVKERQENELVNNASYGLLSNVAPTMRVGTRSGAPTPDDLDELIARVWKEPAFFLAHPRAIAAFGRECTRRGVPPATVTLFGSPFITWRGIPIIPSDKLAIDDQKNGHGKTNILLLRTGEKKRGVVGLFQPGIPGEVSPSLSVRLMGINQKGAASYLVSLYCSTAILTDDALGVLENVEVSKYHDYK